MGVLPVRDARGDVRSSEGSQQDLMVVGVILLGVGYLLITSGFKGISPLEQVSEVFGGGGSKDKAKPSSTITTSPAPTKAQPAVVHSSSFLINRNKLANDPVHEVYEV